MNGIDLMNNLVDELNRARDLIKDLIPDFDNAILTMFDVSELFDDIREDLDRYYDYAESFDAVLEDIVIE